MAVDYRIQTLVRKNLRPIFYGSLCLVLVDGLGFLLPALIKLAIDRLQGQPWPGWMPDSFEWMGLMPVLVMLVLFYIGLAAIIAVGRYWWRVFFIWSSFPIFHELRKEFFRFIHSLHLDFFKSAKTGDLISVLSNDTENLRMLISIGALMVIDASLNFIIFPIVLYQLNSSLTLSVLPPLFILAILAARWSDRFSGAFEKVQTLTGTLSAKAFEIASGIRVIKAFRKESVFLEEFVKVSRELKDAANQVNRFQALFVPTLEFILGLGTMAIILFGGLKVIEGEMNLSNFVAFNLYFQNLDWPLMALGWFIQMYRTARASEGRIFSIRSVQNPLLHNPPSKRIPYNSQYEFRIEDVALQLPDMVVPVIRNINLQLPTSKWVGLTGPVGSGKTLFLELLSRQRDPTRGIIYFRGDDIRSFSDVGLAERVLYVPQETFLFSKSIRSNLTIGLDRAVSDEQIEDLLKSLRFDLSSLHDRGGIWTKLGERGVNLSGGQKQRLSLGRALLRKREVYLFDDLFSHVDVQTEAELIEYLKRILPPQSLVVLVSQRVSTLSRCDSVLVINKGGVEYFGPSERALQESVYFQQLNEIQEMLRAEAFIS